jgi:hypothetical protein
MAAEACEPVLTVIPEGPTRAPDPGSGTQYSDQESRRIEERASDQPHPGRSACFTKGPRSAHRPPQVEQGRSPVRGAKGRRSW